MKAVNVTRAQIERALEQVNERYGGNLRLKDDIRETSKSVSFGLTVHRADRPGGRRGFTRNADGERRRVCAACWHAHGHLFEAIFRLPDIAPNAYIRTATGMGCGLVTGPEYEDGNWQDRQIGSMFDPLYYSEACDCE